MTPSRRQFLTGTALGAIGLAASRGALAQPVTPPEEQARPLLHLPARKRISLDGEWRYILDPFDAAKRGNNQRRTFWNALAPGPEGPLVEYDWEASPTIDLPRDWNSHAAELLWYDGPVYFRRTFTAEPAPAKRRFLAFEAVNYHATVWLNAEKIAEHEGGFTPFAVDVTDKLRPGENAVTICADSRHHAEAVPTDYTDWQNYGGITRSVWLIETPATRIDDVFVRLDGERVVADVTLTGPEAAGQRIAFALGALKLSGVTGADGMLRLSAKRAKSLTLWSPESPVLHPLTVTSPADSITDSIGLRTITTRGREILLNGAPLFLRGISLHEEPIGPVGTRRMTEADARRLLREAKALGCNFVRLAHYPHSEVTLRVADELGLIVWSEIPVYWEQIAYGSPHTLALARSMLADMIRRDRNRCAIGLWSVANETPVEEPRTRFLRTLIADARALDPTRLITAALNKNVDVGGAAEGTTRFSVEDPLGADLDVLAVNQYEAWYSDRSPDEIAGVSFTSIYDKPLMFSEFGADAKHGTRGPREHLWTEEYQAWLYEETLKLVDRTPGCVGLSPWVLKDFRSPRRWHGKHQQFWNRKGLIAETGERKLAWQVLHDYYCAEAARDA
jgi:beta-glucuronidase